MAKSQSMSGNIVEINFLCHTLIFSFSIFIEFSWYAHVQLIVVNYVRWRDSDVTHVLSIKHLVKCLHVNTCQW